MSISLVDKADVKAYLEKTVSNFDTLLDQIIPQVSGQIETYLNRKLKLESRTEYFTGGRKTYYVSAFPIAASPVPVVTVDDDVQVVDDDYYISENQGLFEFVADTENPNPKAVKIVWTGGYTETTGVLAVPDDMRLACILQTVHVFKRRNDVGLTNFSTPDGTIAYQGEISLLKGVKELLNPHRSKGGPI
jgi:hypothetical protein